MWFDISVAIGQHHNALAELQDQFAEICEGWDWPGADPTLSCPALHTRLGFSPPQFHHKPSHEISPALCGNHNCIKPDFGLFCDFLRIWNDPGQSKSLALDLHTTEKPPKLCNDMSPDPGGISLPKTKFWDSLRINPSFILEAWGRYQPSPSLITILAMSSHSRTVCSISSVSPFKEIALCLHTE